MPTYSYRCPDCGHEYEKLQRISDDTRIKCPECGVLGERLITAGAGFVFKGSGFYITDNRQVSSPTLTPPKELDKPKDAKETKELPAGEAKKELPAPKEAAKADAND